MFIMPCGTGGGDCQLTTASAIFVFILQEVTTRPEKLHPKGRQEATATHRKLAG